MTLTMTQDDRDRREMVEQLQQRPLTQRQAGALKGPLGDHEQPASQRGEQQVADEILLQVVVLRRRSG